jgi:hypothetical protein
MGSDRKTTLQNLLDWLRLNPEENSVVIEKVLSLVDLEKSQIEDSYHQAQTEMVSIVSEYIDINPGKKTLEDREDAEEYYKNKFMFNDNVIGENRN